MRASLTLAVGALLLLSLAFIALLTPPLRQYLSPLGGAREQMVFRLPMPEIPRPPLMRPLAPPAPASRLDRLSPLPALPEPPVAPLSTAIQDYLQVQQPSVAAQLRSKVTGGDLTHELQKTSSAPALQDNQSFRTAGGDKVVRSRDNCAQIHTVQGSSSPTNKIDIAEPMPSCPGASGQDMGKALQDWADKHRPPPP